MRWADVDVTHKGLNPRHMASAALIALSSLGTRRLSSGASGNYPEPSDKRARRCPDIHADERWPGPG